MNNADLPLRKTLCGTCPFKEGSPYAELAADLIASGVGRICHSTGSNGIHAKTGLPDHLCRGARDAWQEMLTANGFLAEATDAAWDAKRVEMGMKPTIVKDPAKER